MSLLLLDRTLDRVAIIDDTANVRRAFSYHVEDLDLTPILEAGPLPDLAACIKRLTTEAQAALCDFQLRVSNYAAFDGAQLVAGLYQASMPAVLCTRFEKSSIDQIRRFRSQIPCLLAPRELTDVALSKGFETCLREFRNEYAEDRRAWRTLVRVQNVEEHYAYLFVPAWSSSEGLRLLLSDLPNDFAARLKPGFRCHAHVNLGAVKQEDLYFTNWES